MKVGVREGKNVRNTFCFASLTSMLGSADGCAEEEGHRHDEGKRPALLDKNGGLPAANLRDASPQETVLCQRQRRETGGATPIERPSLFAYLLERIALFIRKRMAL